jgi:hypothetical protein
VINRVSRETVIAIIVAAVVVTTMAIDHLIGTKDQPGDEEGLADPAAFLLSVAVSLTLAAFLFGFVVRRSMRDEPDRAAKKAIVCALLAIPAIALLFLGLPFPLAGAAVALGLLGREGTRRRLATAAVLIGALVLALGTGAYVAALLGV